MRHLFPVRCFWHFCLIYYKWCWGSQPRISAHGISLRHYTMHGQDMKQRKYLKIVPKVWFMKFRTLVLKVRHTLQPLYFGCIMPIFPRKGNMKILIAPQSCCSDIYIELTRKHWNTILSFLNPCISEKQLEFSSFQDFFNCGIAWRKMHHSLLLVQRHWWDLMWKAKLSLCSLDSLDPWPHGIVGKYLQLSHGNKIASCRGLDPRVTDIRFQSWNCLFS